MKQEAHAAVAKAIADGELVREPCEECGATPAVAHHDDYTKRLDVRWLCQSHHVALHWRLRREDGTAPVRMVRITAGLTASEYAQLADVARSELMSVSRMARVAILEYLDRLNAEAAA